MDRVNPVRIALFGGTFDPVHNGHIQLIRSLIKSLLVDDVWILPSPTPPHKPDATPASYDHRVQMIRLAVKEHDLPVSICEVERDLPSPSYTIQTIRHLQESHPEFRFYLSVGADSLRQFHDWKSYEEILERVPLLVARRPGWSNEKIEHQILERTVYLDHPDVEISSHQIRQLLADKGDLHEKIVQFVPESVWSYIQQNSLYQNV